MDTKKLLVFPSLKELITSAKFIEKEVDKYKNSKNTWYVLENALLLNRKKLVVRFNIRLDANGKIYYDHAIKKPFNNRISLQEYEPD
jgi:hypothetical protein